MRPFIERSAIAWETLRHIPPTVILPQGRNACCKNQGSVLKLPGNRCNPNAIHDLMYA